MHAAAPSNVAAGQKVERPVLAAVGCLKLVPQTELPLVLQLQSGDGLPQRTPILADHAEGGACGKKWSEAELFKAQLVALKRLL